MDPQTFDRLVKRGAEPLTRRSVMAGSLLAILGLGEAALARNRHKDQGRGDHRQRAGDKRTGTVTAQARLNLNERCPKKKHGKKLTCADCRTGFSVSYTNAKGKTVQKCACKPVGEACSAGTAANCCSGICGDDGACAGSGQVCLELGQTCSADAVCCNQMCNAGASTTGPSADFANQCTNCKTGIAPCNPGFPGGQCCSPRQCTVPLGQTSDVCTSVTGEQCVPDPAASATAPLRGSCANNGDICPVAGNAVTPGICCRTPGLPAIGNCATGQSGCCTGECNPTGHCCVPPGKNPTASGFPVACVDQPMVCCSGICDTGNNALCGGLPNGAGCVANNQCLTGRCVGSVCSF